MKEVMLYSTLIITGIITGTVLQNFGVLPTTIIFVLLAIIETKLILKTNKSRRAKG